jgi:hypothetical protein
MVKLRGDFNGLFGSLLCLSHGETAIDESGVSVRLQQGMDVLAFEADVEDGQHCFLVARGYVVPSPDSLQHRGSRWCLQIDGKGVRHIATLDDA